VSFFGAIKVWETAEEHVRSDVGSRADNNQINGGKSSEVSVVGERPSTTASGVHFKVKSYLPLSPVLSTTIRP
jgi:hypothetical protein